MKTYTVAEVQDIIAKLTCMSNCQIEYDNYGQLILYTGIFQWSDENYRDEPEVNDLSEEEELDLNEKKLAV